MSYTAHELITEAYYISGIVSAEYETVTGYQISRGLKSLNKILNRSGFDTGIIPYYTEYEFNAVIGQEEYFVANLVQADTLTFNLNSVRYSIAPQNRKAYQGSFRANNINSLMFVYHIERTKGGATLFMYFEPDQAYPCTLWGQFTLSGVTQFQDLSATIDLGYIEYLEYELAMKLCVDNDFSVTVGLQQEYDKVRKGIDKGSAIMDLSVSQIVTGAPESSPNYGWANLSTGWFPPTTSG